MVNRGSRSLLFWKKISLQGLWSVFFVNSVKIDDDAEIVDFENNYENETFYFPSFRTQSFIRSLPHVS